MSELTTAALARSFLFVPATRPDRFAKAVAAGADQVVIDLEDAVEHAAKQEARDALATWLLRDEVPVVVRVNPPGGEHGAADIELLRRFRGRRGIAAVAVPKVEHPDDLVPVRAAVGPDVALLPIIETAVGLTVVASVAGAAGVVRLISGNLDLALDLLADFDVEHVAVAVKMPLVIAGRVAGLCPPVDGPHPGFGDPQLVLESARRARAAGFRAKICIHPSQIGPVHEGFSPSRDEEEWARRILSVASTQTAGAFQLDGRMVDRPVIDWAEEVIHGLPHDTTREAIHESAE